MLTFLTGSRPSEIAKAKWSDIDFDTGIWSYLVQKGNKNRPEGRLHTVTLSRQAIAILNKMKMINDALGFNTPFVFPSAQAKAGHLTIEAIRQAIVKSYGVGNLTTH